MYYPYLRGRQFELKAVQEYAENRGVKNNVIPIIEPVKKTFANLKTAIAKLSEKNVRFALILNPRVGEIEDPAVIIENLNDTLSSVAWTPAVIVKTNYSEISALIDSLGYTNMMLICSEGTDFSNDAFQDLVKSDKITHIVSGEDRTLKRILTSLGKHFIRLDDHFNVQKRNSDFLEMPEEKFSEEHIYYTVDGFQGFADYTCISSIFSDSGGVPYAVAIHLTYQKPSGEIWIKHFASSIGAKSYANIQGKFAEAAKKAVTFLDENNIHTEASEELRYYFNNSKYPGLGMVKKISIKHHLELVNNII